MSSCERCETLPNIPTAVDKVYLWPPLGHSTGKALAAARRINTVVEIPGGLLVNVGDEGPGALIELLAGALTDRECADSLCLLHLGDAPPGLTDFGRVTTLARAINLYSSGWLMDVLSSGRLSSAYQPIVHTKSPYLPFGHECLLRWTDEDGKTQLPGKLFNAAKGIDLLFQLDRSARETHIRNAAAAGVEGKIFINFTPTAIYDPRNCLRTTFKLIEDLGITPEQVVFEVVETEQVDDPAHLNRILNHYKDHGFGVALDDLGAGHATLKMLGDLLPDYVKLDMDLVRNVHADRFKGEVLRHIIALARNFGIQVIAEGIETAEEAAWLTSQRVDFLQGFYFAKPGDKPVRRVERRGQ